MEALFIRKSVIILITLPHSGINLIVIVVLVVVTLVKDPILDPFRFCKPFSIVSLKFTLLYIFRQLNVVRFP